MKETAPMHASIRGALIGALALLITSAQARGPALAGVEIRRTSDDIPHLRAANWRDLGTGIGYVQAQDALCTLAEGFATWRGERSLFFGAEARPAHHSTFGKPLNLELDFFFRGFADDATIARARAAQPRDLLDAAGGFARGYNRYLAEARRGGTAAARQACIDEPWVREINADDILRRFYAAQVAAGWSRFIPEIVNARPAAPPAAVGDATRWPRQQVGDHPALGSNMLAFGRAATGEAGGVLFGNPHWYWGGPDRFYQMHLTIPGRVDVAGVAFLGVPLVMIGFNDRIAWSHTVSAARRFGLFDLTLDPADPTRYLVDGRSEPMQRREVTVDTRAADGSLQRVTRTLYGSRFGPIVDLGKRAAPFGWGTAHAIAMRDVNGENFRVFRTFLAWNQARSLDDFIAIQKREDGMPWVNTAAIGRGDGRAWLGDVGAVPNVPDELRAACSTPLAQGFAGVDPVTPFLDGSRAACDWRSDAAAVQPGTMPVSQMPGLLREDYVANMNDSYWLSNPKQPLEGFAKVLGGERQALSLRGRLGHRIAQELSGRPDSAEALSRRVRQAVLLPRALSAELFKGELLAGACAQPRVVLAGREVDVGPACEVLARWPDRADADARGALLWDAFWTRLDELPPGEFFGVPFAAEAPLATPRAPKAGDPRVAQALAATVVAFGERGWALDAPLGSRRFVQSGRERLALTGGCHVVGYFNVACDGDDTHPIGADAVADTYLQVVHFGPQGVVAHTLLAHGEGETAIVAGEGPADASVARYARHDWLRFPFREDEIARDPKLRTTRLR